MSRGSLWRREPLGVLLVAVNLTLAGILAYRLAARRSAPPRLPPGHPDVSLPAGFAAPRKTPASVPPGLADFALSGTVRLSPALKDPWPKGAYVFVIARAPGGGPPYAVRRYEDVRPPFAWTLDPKDAMLADAPVPPKLVVSVRVDQDGNALTRQLGDLEGGPSAPVAPKSSVELVVDRAATLAEP